MRKVLHYSLFVFAIGLLVSSLSVTEARAQNVLGEILKRMDVHNKALQSLQADVSMIKTDANLGSGGTDTYSGNVSYLPKTPKHVMYARVNWTSPQDEWMVVVGDAF